MSLFQIFVYSPCMKCYLFENNATGEISSEIQTDNVIMLHTNVTEDVTDGDSGAERDVTLNLPGSQLAAGAEIFQHSLLEEAGEAKEECGDKSVAYGEQIQGHNNVSANSAKFVYKWKIGDVLVGGNEWT